MKTFTAIDLFTKKHPGWDKYIQWSKLDHLDEVISIDCSLCPFVLSELNSEDWNNISEEKRFFGLFKSADYCIRRFKDFDNTQVVAIQIEPSSSVEEDLFDSRFVFKGYDLVEEFSRISALTNCGGFKKSFSNSDLNSFGLIQTFEKVLKIQHSLRSEYPEESHADCIVIAIWRQENVA